MIASLLSNAIKFTKVKGNNDEVTINIKDNGTGIDPEILPRLFTKFSSKSDIGTGMGLYISKNIVDAHGGRMWAENNSDGSSAMLTFTLPLLTSRNSLCSKISDSKLRRRNSLRYDYKKYQELLDIHDYAEHLIEVLRYKKTSMMSSHYSSYCSPSPYLKYFLIYMPDCTARSI